MHLKEIKASERDKVCLEELKEPMNVAQVAANLDTTYNYAFTKLQVWVAKNWVTKIGYGKKTRYYLNQDAIQLESFN